MCVCHAINGAVNGGNITRVVVKTILSSFPRCPEYIYVMDFKLKC